MKTAGPIDPGLDREPDDTRRRLLVAVALALPAAALAGCRSAESRPVASLLGARLPDGRDAIVLYDAGHGECGRIPIGARAHGFAFDPRQPGRVAVIGRRPGTESWILDLARGELVAHVRTAPGRHFYGHGVFTGDGRYLLTTENDYESGQGRIVVRSADDWRVAGEMPAHGVGPHEMRLMPDGKTLAVAMGGIRSHPDRPRTRADIDAMQPALNYIDVASGKLLGSYRPPDHHLGIRHLAVVADGTVLLAMQHPGDPAEAATAPLLARHRGEDALVFPEAEPGDWAVLRGYLGGIEAAVDGDWAVASSPRGNTLAFWNWRANRIETTLPMLDVCAVEISPDGATASAASGAGEIRDFACDAGRWNLARVVPADARAPLAYDNHMAPVGRT